MELAQIRYFFAVCEARHFTRAARQCGISQPSLSNAIRRLEEEFGGPLFDRGPPVALSPLGEAVKPHFTAIRREVDSLQRLFASLAFNSEAARTNGGAPERRVRIKSAQAGDG